MNQTLGGARPHGTRGHEEPRCCPELDCVLAATWRANATNLTMRTRTRNRTGKDQGPAVVVVVVVGM